MTLLLVHAGTTCFLAGLSWLVQLVVYPGFRTVGPTAAWDRFHAEHGRRLARTTAVPWAAHGAALAALLVEQDGSGWLLAGAAVCAAGPVALTVLGAVPIHGRLTPYDAGLVRRLLRVSAGRTALWTVGAVISLLLLR